MCVIIRPCDVAVLVLNYRGSIDTLDCLRCLNTLESPPRSVIVIDNNSNDGSVEIILRKWSDFASPVLCTSDASNFTKCLATAIILPLTTNGGYSAGNNAGIRMAFADPGCKAVWILNNDTEPQPGSLKALCERLNTVPKSGIAGSTVVYAHDKTLVQCAGGGKFNHWLGTTSASCGRMRLEQVLVLDPTLVETRLDDIIGASMLIRRELVDSIGSFAEEFFLYTEETEYCIRARKAGYTFAWAADSIVFHREGASTGAQTAIGNRVFTRPAWVDYLSLRNRVWLMRLHYPWALPVVALSYLGVAINRLRRGQADRIILVCKAFWHGLCGKMGKPRADIYPSNTP